MKLAKASNTSKISEVERRAYNDIVLSLIDAEYLSVLLKGSLERKELTLLADL